MFLKTSNNEKPKMAKSSKFPEKKMSFLVLAEKCWLFSMLVAFANPVF